MVKVIGNFATGVMVKVIANFATQNPSPHTYCPMRTIIETLVRWFIAVSYQEEVGKLNL